MVRLFDKAPWQIAYLVVDLTEPPPFDLEDPSVGAAARVEWLAITRAASEAVDAAAPDLWLGQLIVVVQQASDRAGAAARSRADAIVADARAEAITIRAKGRSRARVVSELRAEMRRAALDSDPSPFALPGEAPVPPPSSSSSFSEPPAAVPVPVVRPAPAVSSAARKAGGEKGPPVRLQVRVGAVVAAVAILVAALGVRGFEAYGTASREQRSQQHLMAAFANIEASRGTNAAWPVNGGPFALLDIPRLAINGQAVVEGATLADLRRGPARDSASQLPGQRGAVVILGRRRTYGAPFARLGQLRAGDVISMRTPSALWVYRVSASPQVLPPGATLQMPSAVDTNGGPGDPVDQALVLATSVSSRGQSLEVVVATLDQASTTGSPAASASASGQVVAQLRSVPGQRIGIVLFGLWLLVLAGALALARRFRPRLPPAFVYGACSVVVLIALFQLYLAVDRLLPGTY
jgi:sortase A